MAKKQEGVVDVNSLSYEEMDIVFAALGEYQKGGARVAAAAEKAGIKKAAASATEFYNRVDALKQKFLHE